MGLILDKDERSDSLSLYASDESIAKQVKDNEKRYFKVRFNFMNGHCGPRPGDCHLFFGTAGSGKTTLIKSIIADCAVNAKVLLYQSEETVSDLRLQTSKQKLKKEIRENIRALSEVDIAENRPEVLKDVELYKKYFAEQISLIKPAIVFFDNLTTSMMYERLPVDGQVDLYLWFKSFFKKIGIPCIFVGHTKTGVYDGQAHLIDLDDLRGSKIPSNVTPYVYIFQRFKISGEYFPFVRVRKSRMHQHEGMFHCKFDKERNMYLGDSKMDFDRFKEVFNKRERL